MKGRYAIFAGQEYYPMGGYNDFIVAVDDAISVNRIISGLDDSYTWAHVVDVHLHNIIICFGRERGESWEINND